MNPIDFVVQEIHNELTSKVQPGRAQAMETVAPGIECVLGVPVPEINAIAKKYKEYGLTLVEALWATGVYEERLTAVKILGLLTRNYPDEALHLLREFTPQITEWTICDTLASGVSRKLYTLRQLEILGLSAGWLSSANVWERRMSLVLLVYSCRFPEYQPEIRRRVEALSSDKAHYIRRAVTWLRRELDKHGG